MTTNEVKDLILSAKAIKRESERMKQEIEQRREELLSIQSTMNGGDRVISSEKLSMPERVYFSLEKLYTQYSEVLQRLHDKNNEIESAIALLDPLEQEIVRAWIDGKTEERIGNTIGYSRRSVQYIKKRILVRLSELK